MVDWAAECEREVGYGRGASSARPFRPGLAAFAPPLAWRSWQEGATSKEQPPGAGLGVLGFAHRISLAGPPVCFGDWKNAHRRFCRWRDGRVRERRLDSVTDDPDFERLMIDASHIGMHPHGAGARGGNQSINRTKGA